MSVGHLVLSSNRLDLSGKKGMFKPNEHGYYTMPIGGFNCHNSLGEFYTMEGVDKCMGPSSNLQRDIANGRLMGEYGHPVQPPGMPESEFSIRFQTVDDKETCALLHKVWNDPHIAQSKEFQEAGVEPNTVITMADLKPHGRLWETLQRAFDDPHVNIGFSVRNLSYDRWVNNVCHVILAKIITWDAVIKTGIGAAQKWLSPRLERDQKIVVTPALVDAMEKALYRNALRQESIAPTVELIDTARSFFRFSQRPRAIYRDWDVPQ